jgi:H+/Cl- antiporter ClcA
LIVFVAWFRWILEATANVIYSIYNPKGQSIIDFSNQNFSMFIFTIVVGILIGIASVLLIHIASRSTKKFFQQPEKNQSSK